MIILKHIVESSLSKLRNLSISLSTVTFYEHKTIGVVDLAKPGPNKSHEIFLSKILDLSKEAALACHA